MHHVRLALALVLFVVSMTFSARGEEYRTPRAGESWTGALFGFSVSAPRRDRANITTLSLGVAPVPDGPEETTLGPQGGFYFWRAGENRLRAIVAGIANEVRWDNPFGSSSDLFSVVMLDTATIPWARSEYADGVRLARGELKRSQARAGFGLAWRKGMRPWQSENAFDAAATFTFGDLWFDRGPDTAPTYVLPNDTFEARVHLLVRADALERNLVELPHRGWSAGLDGFYGRRARWEPWGLPAEGLEKGSLSWLALSGFAYAAFSPVPGVSERHRVITSVHAGIGHDLDRFSAFRLGGGSTWGDYETLSRLVLPGAGVNEIYTRRYASLDLEYRYELFAFLYLQLRGTLTWADVPGATPRDGTRGQTFRAMTAGLTTGLPWGMAMELAAARNSDLVTVANGQARNGRTGFLVNVTRQF